MQQTESLKRAVYQMTDKTEISEADVRLWFDAYKKAWETRDVAAALAIFTEDVDYREKRFGEPLLGHKDLRGYWQDRVFEHQRDISFNYQLWAVNGPIAVSGWQSSFTWLPINGIMEIDAVCRVHFVRKGDKVLCSQFHEWMDHREFR